MQSRITSTTHEAREAQKSESRLADIWINRWRRFSRQGLECRGYPKRAAFSDPSWFYEPDDEPNYIDERVKELLDSYKGRARDILIDYYFMGLSMSEVALKNGMSKGGVEWRIKAIRIKVVKVVKQYG